MLIGYRASVKDRGIEGTVIDETKNTLLFATNEGIKRIIKDKNRFIVYTDGRKVKIRGEEINLRPWEYAV